jgi:hypothetical protein
MATTIDAQLDPTREITDTVKYDILNYFQQLPKPTERFIENCWYQEIVENADIAHQLIHLTDEETSESIGFLVLENGTYLVLENKLNPINTTFMLNGIENEFPNLHVVHSLKDYYSDPGYFKRLRLLDALIEKGIKAYLGNNGGIVAEKRIIHKHTGIDMPIFEIIFADDVIPNELDQKFWQDVDRVIMSSTKANGTTIHF